MEGEGEADRKEESAEPRGGGGARVVEGETETEADRRCEAGARSDQIKFSRPLDTGRSVNSGLPGALYFKNMYMYST